jgi:CHASE2 domain-containing sensor protein
VRNDIIIVGIDENTLREFDSKGIQWPFDWRVHAKVTDYLTTGNPLAIFFDIVFLEHKSGEKGAGRIVSCGRIASLLTTVYRLTQ